MNLGDVPEKHTIKKYVKQTENMTAYVTFIPYYNKKTPLYYPVGIKIRSFFL